ncbi:succinylglutamate desuccinylase/aspartoacylase family protein [candidate division KSB1 bacterium]
MIFSNNAFEIADTMVEPGERKQLRLKVSESFISNPTYIPLTVINGKSPGPKVLITAAIHGNELNGIEIVRQLIYELKYENLAGTLVCVPVVNIYGFQNASRYLPEGKDLNRFFPGDPSKWSQGLYAWIIFNELVKKCDYVIDLHTASEGRSNLPHIRGDMSNPEVSRLAHAFGTTVILDSTGVEGTLRRTATEAGIPTIVLEAGETRKFEKKKAETGLEGVLNVLRELKMLPGEIHHSPYQIIVKDTTWIRVDHGGILTLKVIPGRIVKKGKEIATNTNPFGMEVESIRTPFSGIVIGVATAPTMTPGQGICHLFKIDEPVKTIRERLYSLYGKKRIVY